MRCTTLLIRMAAGLLFAVQYARAADLPVTANAAGSPPLQSPRAAPIRVEPFWLEPELLPGTKPYLLPAILRIPDNWVGGDGAVIILSDPDTPTSGPLVTALLTEGALVLELDIAASRGQPVDNASDRPAVNATALQPDLAIALDQLRREVGAGLVVAIGAGPASGAAAIGALPGSPELAAAIALHGDTAEMEAKGSNAARATLGGLCRALDRSGNRAVETCREALFNDRPHAAR